MSGLSLARTYDALNRPTRIDEGNLRLNFGYTNFGAFKGALSFENAQPINGSLDPGDALRAVAYGYTAELLSRQTRPDQTVSYTNDILGRLLGVSSHAGGFSYTYNGGGNRVQTLNYPATYSSWAYDAMAELTNLNIYVSDGQTTVGYDYDLNGNRLHVWRAKDLASGYDSQVAYGYDAIGQLTSAVGTETGGTSRLNEQFGYGYDLAGNLTARTNGALTQAFTADGANELTNLVRSGSLTFAGQANPALTSLTVNSQSTAQYSDQTFATTTGLALANGTNTFTVIAADPGGDRITNIYTANLPSTNRCKYDANGNLITDGIRGFDYDGLNELVRVTVTNAWKTEYDYDGLGRHHDRREYVWWPGTASWYLVNECYYVYAGHQVVQEVNTTEGTASYVYGLSLMERDSTVTNQPTLFYHTDANGNVTTLFDGTGQVQARYLYDPYGNLLARSGPMADVNHYRFSGQEWDPHTGLYYYGYRFYDPNFQRWLNQDPIAENGGINLYEFVVNNPVNYVDRFGLDFSLWSGGGTAYNNWVGGQNVGNIPVTPTKGELQLSVGFSGTVGVMSHFTGLPNSFISAGNYVGITSHGTLFFQHNNTRMNGFGLFGGINLSLQLAYSKCTMETGKTVSTSTHGEVGLGDFSDIELSGDLDNDSVGGDIPLPQSIKPQIGIGGGFIMGAGQSETTTYAEPPGSGGNTSYQNSPSYLYGL